MNLSFRIISASFLLSSIVIAHANESTLTGSYATTANISGIDTAITSINHRVGLNFKPTWSQGNLDYRVESYTETSFHTPNQSIINEHKFETQLNYNYPLTDKVSMTAGLLYHTNNTFPDTYFWAITGMTYNQKIFANTTISAALFAEKRTKGGRIFYDASSSMEYRFHPLFSAFGSIHRYENLGESDTQPSRKLEYEVGINHNPSQRFFAGLSYLHHSQDNDPDDRFALAKLKFGINF